MENSILFFYFIFETFPNETKYFMLHLSDEFSSFSRSERALRHGNTETEGPLELLSKPKKSNECDGDNERPNVQVLVTPLRVLSGPRVAVEEELSYWQQAPGCNQM